jgi:hypothetical protein
MLQQPLSTYTPHILIIKPTLNTKQCTTMADCLPLAKLSIQNTTHPPTEATQLIKTNKVCLLRLPNLPHPLSLDTLPSPTNKWSTMTHPLCTAVMGFCGLVIWYAHFYFILEECFSQLIPMQQAQLLLPLEMEGSHKEGLSLTTNQDTTAG